MKTLLANAIVSVTFDCILSEQVRRRGEIKIINRGNNNYFQEIVLPWGNICNVRQRARLVLPDVKWYEYELPYKFQDYLNLLDDRKGTG